jgi:hypothetical protein
MPGGRAPLPVLVLLRLALELLLIPMFMLLLAEPSPVLPDWTGSSNPRASRVLMIAFSFSESKSISRVVGVVAGRSPEGESGSPHDDVKMEGPKAAEIEAEGKVRDPDR